MMTTPVQLMTINYSNAAAVNSHRNVADFMTKVPPNSFSGGWYCGHQRGSASEKCSSNKTIITIIDDDDDDSERSEEAKMMIFQNGFA